MPTNYSVYFNLRDIRGLTRLYLLTFVVFALAYAIGFGELRYSADRIQPIEHFEAWMFYLGIAMPILGVTVVFNLVVQLMSSKYPSTFLIVLSGIILLAQAAWNLVVVVINLSVWFNCNDGTVSAPAHPECINRNYPTDTLPDWSFMIIVISSGGLGVSALFGALLCYNANNALAAGAQTDYQIGKKIHGGGSKNKKHHGHRDQYDADTYHSGSQSALGRQIV